MVRMNLSACARRAGIGALAFSAGCAVIQAPVLATWSIILIDTRTGEVAIGSATCVTGLDLKSATPVLLTGIGGATAQSAVDSTGQNRVFIRDQLLLGVAPANIVAGLASFDGSHQSRQYGIVDTRAGGRATTFTGSGAGQYRGGFTRRLDGAGVSGGDVLMAVQGNVLAGAPVIDAAAEAIRATRGDLPEKLMAGMEAARLMGGDGRCSCSVNNPAGCGSPPENFTKSSHIAFMMIARAGDRDGCNGLYRVGSSPQSTIAADLNADGLPDLITTNSTASSVSVNLNQSPTPGAGTPIFSAVPVNATVASSPRDLAAADLNGDELMDVVVCNLISDNVSVLLGQGDGTFQTRVNYAAGNGPIALATGDFDGDGDVDLAVVNQSDDSVSILINDGAGIFTNPLSPAAGDGPTSIDAADLDADGDLDLVVGAATSQAIIILRNTTAAGGDPVSFANAGSVSAGRGISGVAAGDFNRDGLVDLAASATTDNRLSVVLQDAAGSWTPAVPYAVAPAPTGIAARDVTGDDVPDLVTVTRQTTLSSLAVLEGSGDGSFHPARPFLFGIQPGRFSLADLDADGDLDAVLPVTSSGASAMVIENFGVARGLWSGFSSGLGCATGDYFMDFNVANQQAGDPDPVFTLRERFDQWRAGHVGRLDAVRTVAVFDRSSLPADGESATRLTIWPRDWRNEAVSAGIGSIEIVRAPGSDAVVTLGPVIAGDDGSFTLTLTSTGAIGADRLLVRIEDSSGGRPVVLMPMPIIGAFSLDWDGQNGVTTEDLFRFLEDFLNGRADLNHDGITNSEDYFAFVTAFFGG